MPKLYIMRIVVRAAALGIRSFGGLSRRSTDSGLTWSMRRVVTRCRNPFQPTFDSFVLRIGAPVTPLAIYRCVSTCRLKRDILPIRHRVLFRPLVTSGRCMDAGGFEPTCSSILKSA